MKMIFIRKDTFYFSATRNLGVEIFHLFTVRFIWSNSFWSTPTIHIVQLGLLLRHKSYMPLAEVSLKRTGPKLDPKLEDIKARAWNDSCYGVCLLKHIHISMNAMPWGTVLNCVLTTTTSRVPQARQAECQCSKWCARATDYWPSCRRHKMWKRSPSCL